MSQHSTPYAVPAVGMRKCMICPVCGDAFLATTQHRWIAYIPRMRYEKPVCSYHCMREMERKLGRWQSIHFIDPEEEAENLENTSLQSTEQMSLSELWRKKRELEDQLSPIMAEVNQLYDTRRMSKIDDYRRGNLFTREKELMEQLGQINRQIREEQQHGKRSVEGRIQETGRRAGHSGGRGAGAH